jgi:hypothetical protein
MNQKSIHDRIMSRNHMDHPEANDANKPLEPRRNWLRTSVFSLVGIVVVAAAGYAAATYDVIRALAPQPAVAETNEANQKLADTPFLQHAKQAGLQACSTIFPALGELLTNGTQFSIQSAWNSEAPDKHAVQAFVGMDYATEDYSGPAAGVVFAAPTGSACEGAMMRVAPFPTSCADIPAVFPQGSKLTNNLGKVAVYELGGNGGNALLLPTGKTCVVISVASAVR